MEFKGPLGELVFDNVKIPKENILPNKDGLGNPLVGQIQHPIWNRWGPDTCNGLLRYGL